MIIFHEGLPRSGKTWEAIIVMAFAAIKAGRHVVTNVKGVDAQRIAEVLQLDADHVRGLLTLVPWEDSPRMHEYAKTDSLVIFDEIQDFFPKGCRLTPEQTAFITQHGQRGIDIVLCGQSRRNVNVFWHDRIERLIFFQKLSAVGADQRYQWKMHTATGVGKFTEVSKGIRRYDPAFYGCYRSHTEDTTNKGAMKDNRVVIWKKPLFTVYLPALVVLAIVSGNFLYGFFTGESSLAKAETTKPVASAPAASVKQAATGVVGAVGETVIPDAGTRTIMEPVRQSPDNYILSLSAKYRPRLAALVYNDRKLAGVIEWLDEGYKVREITQLHSLDQWGWKATRRDSYVMLSRGSDTIIVTPWPVQEWGRANVDHKAT